ncbi:FAD-dependent oxidoreductase [Nonomuraea sp. NBC_01738]|nr:FAD-dependent oxidoreductase [Nonomuraea sp. NBC_01738]
MEPFAGELVAASLRESGIDVRFGADVTAVRRESEGGPVVVELGDGSVVEADEVLVATGRRAAVDGLGLEAFGLGGGPIEVDDSMRVPGVEWLYAVGDVNGRNLLTHMGKYQARVCGDVIAARARGTSDGEPSLVDSADGRGAPQVVFTDPQVCAVGLTEETARAMGFGVRVVEYEIGDVAGASLLGDGYAGRAKAVVDEGRGVLLGVTFAGPDVAELLHAATIAVTAEVPLATLWHAVPAFPTVSEVWLRLLETYGL